MATVGMGQRARGGRATTAGVLAATITAALLAGCATGQRPVDDGRGTEHRPASSPSAAGGSGGGATPDATRSATGPLLAVKIDNVGAARPQAGLDAADVVYAEPVEGGLSRLLAVYASELPEVVGPVRSARESDLELLRQFDRPVLAFSGAQRKLLPLIDRAPLRPAAPDDASGAYFRDVGRTAPHDLYVRPHLLLSTPPGAAALTTGFRYGTAPADGRPESTRTVRYPSVRFSFSWSPDLNRWLVAMDGTPTRTAGGKRVAPATVVVQYVKVHASAYHDVLGSNTPYTETVGSGTAEVLRDGRAYDGFWERRTAGGGTEFTTPEGAPLNFAEGQVWVVYARAGG
ncbi:DUF3048 domain-containing protein [Streptomyces sp. NPDC006012]|uniref:DUF3048 domain-containing protein n=1 Tax=Streptomyces sp. NPDC006012 TaxID=3364739 RepID=UPI0036C039B3